MTKKTWKQMMIETIRAHWYYGPEELERMTESEIQMIYDDLIDNWIES